MFWRLFLTFLLLVFTPVLLVNGIVLLHSQDLFSQLAGDLFLAFSLVIVFGVSIAYYLARRYTYPYVEMTSAAKKVAEGDFGNKIHATGGRELRALARSFNTMTDRLAATFSQIDRDREQLRTVLSGMIEGVIAFDNDQRVLFANDRAAHLLEFAPSNAVGRRFWEITRQRSIQEVAEKVLRDEGPFREELDWKGPSDRSLALYVARLPGPNSPGAVMVLHDMSELRRLERLRQEFVTNVSHELKTPLANIKSSVEVLLDGAMDDTASRGMFLAEIDDQANRLDALIKDLLSLARIESGATGFEMQYVLVEEAVHACLDRHRTRAENKGLTLNGVALGGSASDLTVWVDEEALAQILDNLVDNAIKYTPKDGRVTVRWEMTPQLVWFEVEDTGIGIPDRDQPRIFERFYRVDKARSREMGGTGLGLAIVKHLTQAMNGTIRVASELGKGTTFRLSLPRMNGYRVGDQ